GDTGRCCRGSSDRAWRCTRPRTRAERPRTCRACRTRHPAGSARAPSLREHRPTPSGPRAQPGGPPARSVDTASLFILKTRGARSQTTLFGRLLGLRLFLFLWRCGLGLARLLVGLCGLLGLGGDLLLHLLGALLLAALGLAFAWTGALALA